jgi:DNA replication protein DnaC
MPSTRAIAAGTCSFTNCSSSSTDPADHSEAKLLSHYLSYDCLLIDEIGYVEVEPVQVGLFFTYV